MNSIAITAHSVSTADSFTLAPFTLPDFDQAIERTLTDCLRRSHPNIVFEYASTWLVCHERSATPDQPPIIRSHALLASLTECFTGHFQWQSIDVAGLYGTAMPHSGTPGIGALERDALAALYACVKEELPEQYKKMRRFHRGAGPDAQAGSPDACGTGPVFYPTMPHAQ
jgi:hypothetical protein